VIGYEVSVEADEKWMALALQEAGKGLGRTSPNPCVGALIVDNNKVVGQGYHKKAGTPHAEIHALRNAGEKAKGATLYVTLEPCSHTGQTPPCCEAVVESGIKRVVVGMIDPNPLVSGNGIRYLQDHGIEVRSAVLEQSCIDINRPFIKYITTSTPWVIMKAGLSLDGRISYQKGVSGRITSRSSWERVHRLRDITDGILVGIGTVIADNPSLTTRLDEEAGHDPTRIILDTGLHISKSANVLHLESPSPTWVFCGMEVDEQKVEALRSETTDIFRIETGDDGHIDPKKVLRVLGRRGITSVLVEGGAGIHGSFLRENLVDYVQLFYAPIFAGDGGNSVISDLNILGRQQAIRIDRVNYERVGEDMMVEGEVQYC